MLVSQQAHPQEGFLPPSRDVFLEIRGGLMRNQSQYVTGVSY